MTNRSKLEAEFAQQLTYCGVEEWVEEYRFNPMRRWRCDFAWPAKKVMVEIEGGTWIAGRHSRGKGFENDCEKYNSAAIDGWLVLRFTGKHIKDMTAVGQTTYALNTVRAGESESER